MEKIRMPPDYFDTLTKEKKDEIETIEIHIHYWYDWQVSRSCKVAEALDNVDTFLHNWHGRIIIEDYEERSISYNGDTEAVKKYFASRNLDPPATFHHEAFIRGGGYCFHVFKLIATIRTLDGYFFSTIGEKIDFNEFDARLIENIKECYTHLEIGYRCGGFNITTKYRTIIKKPFFLKVPKYAKDWPEKYEKALSSMFALEEPIFRDEFLANVDISNDLLALIPKENEYIAYGKSKGTYYFMLPDSRETYVFATEEGIKHLHEKYNEIEWVED
ncbi:MAG: hypothetical protein ACFFB5_06465 [Promethearchaeota archaeon]